MIPIQLTFSKYLSSYVPLVGGINENVSSMELQPGELIGCKNYMIAEGTLGGYTSIKGYEQFDGILTPSKLLSYILTVTGCTSEPTIGMTLEVVESGDLLEVFGVTLQDSDTDTYVLECWPDGTVVVSVDNTIEESGSTLGTVSAYSTIEGGTTTYHACLDASYAEVIPVPGEGPILGLFVWKGLTYAFRKAVGLAEVHIYVENGTTGWVKVTQASPLAYSSGNHDFHFVDYNFYATSTGRRFYFCDGVNKARECDGSSTTVITNGGMGANDKPINIMAHNFFLWLVYPGGSLQGSTLGNPLDWTTAPVEFGLGRNITNLVVGLDSSLICILEDGITVLTGTTEDTFDLGVFSDEAGAYPHTAERLLGTTFMMGNQGITSLEAVQSFGNYAANSVSQRYKKTLYKNKDSITLALTSRELNQYRLFFDNGIGIYVAFDGKELKGATLVAFKDPVITACSSVDINGNEKIIFSSTNTDGHVFLMDSGKSFNGSYITHWFETPYYHYKYIRSNKSFKRATFEIFGEDDQTVYVRANFDYNEPTVPLTNLFSTQLAIREGSAVYGETEWGSMIYGATSVTDSVPMYINGVGTNMSLKVLVRDKYRSQHTIQNLICDFEVLGRQT